MAKIKRETFRLSPEESALFRSLLPHQEVAWSFWKRVANSRSLDYKSIIGNPFDRESFTALPLKHGKHWCWPHELKCARSPIEFPHFANTGQPA